MMHDWNEKKPEPEAWIVAKYTVLEPERLLQVCKRVCCVTDPRCPDDCLTLPRYWRPATTDEAAVGLLALDAAHRAASTAGQVVPPAEPSSYDKLRAALPGCFNPDGSPIVASAHLPRDPATERAIPAFTGDQVPRALALQAQHGAVVTALQACIPILQRLKPQIRDGKFPELDQAIAALRGAGVEVGEVPDVPGAQVLEGSVAFAYRDQQVAKRMRGFYDVLRPGHGLPDVTITVTPDDGSGHTD